MISLEWKFHEKRMRMFKKYTQMIRDEFKGYNQKKLKKDGRFDCRSRRVAVSVSVWGL